MKKISFLLFLCIISLPIFSQDMQRVKATIDTLCSSVMFGRGYTHHGATKAAKYIAEKFQSINLDSYQSTYKQGFRLDINTFPEKCQLKIGKKKLTLGVDYLPHPLSSSGQFNGKIFNINLKSKLNTLQLDSALKAIDTRNLVVVLDKTQEALFNKISVNAVQNLFAARGIIFTTEKLTHSVATQQYPIPSFIVNNSFLEDSDIKKVSFSIKTRLEQQYQAYNIIGYVRGTSKTDSSIVFTAHYDHLGGIGDKVYFPGANDNASGVAMLMELAHWYQQNPSKYNITFIAFGAEEAGLIGSQYFTKNSLFPLNTIKVLFNLDLFATGEEGITVVNGSEFTEDFNLMKKANQQNEYLVDITARGAAANSDHYFFYTKGVKSFFFYLRGDWSHYHDIFDAPPVPLSKFEESFKFLVEIEKAYSF